MACLDSTDRLFHWTTPMLETLLKCLCVWSWNKEIVLRAPQIMSVNGIGVGKFLWYILGTCLFTVLNNWFVRLWARLIQLRSGRIWGDLTSQPVPVIISAALFCNFSTLWLRLVSANISPDNTTISRWGQIGFSLLRAASAFATLPFLCV